MSMVLLLNRLWLIGCGIRLRVLFGLVMGVIVFILVFLGDYFYGV